METDEWLSRAANGGGGQLPQVLPEHLVMAWRLRGEQGLRAFVEANLRTPRAEKLCEGEQDHEEEEHRQDKARAEGDVQSRVKLLAPCARKAEVAAAARRGGEVGVPRATLLPVGGAAAVARAREAAAAVGSRLAAVHPVEQQPAAAAA
eukprot:CAMPEP_0195572474 /NCGR_PEP_ID=MMETSP0814-20130614/4759_1 /TAXON_ID=97485 /ORGANISM="Prymnesium parvum, Strain Texoma1" /LENGTH=148 /DNA_ID=CAMNT_0040708245 /DNA_START=211 /DNA_END=654 /DNA_ORIENTATION=+